MGAMNKKKQSGKTVFRSAKECSYAAVFVALLIASQFAFAAIPSVEIVTLLFVTYAFCFGVVRGMICATAFSLLRQIVFGFYPKILILYLLYYNFLTLVFGLLGKKIQNPLKFLWLILLVACVCTALFTVIDNILTTSWYGYTARATKIYWKASIAVMVPQIICTAVSIVALFYPLFKTFNVLKKGIIR